MKQPATKGQAKMKKTTEKTAPKIERVLSDMRIKVRFPVLNKNDTRSRNQAEISRNSRVELCRVTDIVTLAYWDFKEFTETLLRDRDWLRCKGGHSSDFESTARDWLELEARGEADAWRAKAYALVVLVKNENGRDWLAVNPEGHNYARYVGEVLMAGEMLS